MVLQTAESIMLPITQHILGGQGPQQLPPWVKRT